MHFGFISLYQDYEMCYLCPIYVSDSDIALARLVGIANKCSRKMHEDKEMYNAKNMLAPRG